MPNPMSIALGVTAITVLGIGAISFAPRGTDAPATQEATQAAPDSQQVAAQPERDVFKPKEEVVTSPIKWVSYDKGLEQAKAEKKAVFIQYFATWCGYCRKMDKEVFTDPKIQEFLKKNFVPVRVTESSMNKVAFQGKQVTEKELTALSQVTGFPTMVFLDNDGKALGKIPGFIPSTEMNAMMKFISTESYKTMDYATYKQKFMKS